MASATILQVVAQSRSRSFLSISKGNKAKLITRLPRFPPSTLRSSILNHPCYLSSSIPISSFLSINFWILGSPLCIVADLRSPRHIASMAPPRTRGMTSSLLKDSTGVDMSSSRADQPSASSHSGIRKQTTTALVSELPERQNLLFKSRFRLRGDTGESTSLNLLSPVASSAPRPQLITRPTIETKLYMSHSIELSKIALTASFSYIAWSRKIFGRAHTFPRRIFDPNIPDLTYESYKNGNKTEFQYERTPEMTDYLVIGRGQHQAADKLLYWLETGAHDALEKSYLDRVQLNFHEYGAPVTPNTLVESYTIAISYPRGPNGDQTADRDVKSTMKVHEANEECYNMVDGVAQNLAQELRRTGAGRFGSTILDKSKMTMRLWFTKETPSDYRIPGFNTNDFLTETENLSPPDNRMVMQTSFHQLEGYLHKDDLQAPIPDSIRHLENGLEMSNRAALNPSDCSTLSEHSELDLSNPGQLSKGDTEVRTQLERMSKLKTIGITRGEDTETQDTQRLPPRSRLRDGNNRIESGPSQPESDKYSDVKFPNIHYELQCECGLNDEPDLFIKCDRCGQGKHTICYGYLPPDRFEGNILCYTCQSTGTRSKQICLARRVVHNLRDKSQPCGSVFNILDHDDSYTRDLLRELVLQKWIMKTPKGTKYKVGASDEKFREANGLFDPKLNLKSLSPFFQLAAHREHEENTSPPKRRSQEEATIHHPFGTSTPLGKRIGSNPFQLGSRKLARIAEAYSPMSTASQR
ncbi:HORMA domain-containing protein [Amylocarpus encephaloides]|uniref:HORMA domain-containing protein n=1 Tax=Amylocarpus encephaloides TaxID=45428 RepID=A0A9P7YTC1_9HELO|nr:HORMA domain-containing protein [Amylocarpus encephaloides]